MAEEGMTTLAIRVRLGLFCRVDIPYASLRFEEQFDAALLNVPPRELKTKGRTAWRVSRLMGK